MSGELFSPTPVIMRMRAFYAPVNRANKAATIFDPSSLSAFDVDAPASPWIDLGWIDEFSRRSESQMRNVGSGVPSALLEQARSSVGASVSMNFLAVTKMTMALSTNSQQMNVLAVGSTATSSADGGTGITAITILTGSTASVLLVSASDAASISAGSIVAVDMDYSGETGYVGTPFSGSYLQSALTDVDYVRRVTFNVARVSAVSGGKITLASALPGGVPATGMKLQQVTGFVDREGGRFIHEWSALFIGVGSQGERVVFYYPRLQSALGSAEHYEALSGKGESDLNKLRLKASFIALPVEDSLDGERIVCYRSVLPAPNSVI